MWNHKLNEEKLVLVVDDDPFIRESMSEMLEAKGYLVSEAENGQKALVALKKMPYLPCLIVLDLVMPVLDGRGFLKLRAQDGILLEIPVVVVSGENLSGELLGGTIASLRKPINFALLMDVIEHHCSSALS